MAETNYPLLVFPEPTYAERARRDNRGGRVKTPDTSRQAERLAPQFQRLQEVMERKRLALQDNPLGLQPEQVLVLETIGPIQNFIRAVRKVRGLEWLGEYELDDISPEHGFEDEKSPVKQLKGQLFLVMTDQRALQELQSLFRKWKTTPDMTFARDWAPWKNAFKHLYTIRPWDVEDRIRETGILDNWQYRLQHEQEYIPFEAELWFRADERRRKQAESYLRSIISSMNGEVIQQCVIPDIAYHAVLGQLHRTHIQDIIDQLEAHRDVHLLQCDGIMFLRPVGQCTIPLSEDTTETDTLQGEPQPELPQGDPIVALFDGMPLTGHQLLNKRLVVDDPDGYENAYQARERVHGTAMSSLICHGDLNEHGDVLGKPLYVRSIMQPRRGFNGQSKEAIPADVLPVDLVHRAVRRLYETENGEPAAAPSVRIINLSICDLARPLGREMSSWARLLDWLAWKHHILFIVSAGNHPHDLELDVPRPALSGLTAEERERAVVKAVAADTRNRRLLSPAETLNGLTVGAIHVDASSPSPSRLIDPFVRTGLPTVTSAQGPGYRRAIKPDVLLPGGKQFLNEKLGTTHAKATLQTNLSPRPPGQCVASPGNAGQLDRTTHTRGTSDAAALASRGASFLYDLIEQLRQQPDTSMPVDFDVVLTKALLVHGADWADAKSRYETILRNAQNRHTFREYIGRFLGYGPADLAKVMACTEQRVTVLGFGELDDGKGAEFILPLPPSLSAVNERRRLTITLAWLSPVKSTRQNYRVAHLWFDPKQQNVIASDRLCADYRAVQRGTVQHEVLEGDKAVEFQDGAMIAIKVNCRADAGDIPNPIRYGMAVTLEVMGRSLFPVPIYREVRDRLAVRVPVQGARSV